MVPSEKVSVIWKCKSNGNRALVLEDIKDEEEKQIEQLNQIEANVKSYKNMLVLL